MLSKDIKTISLAFSLKKLQNGNRILQTSQLSLLKWSIQLSWPSEIKSFFLYDSIFLILHIHCLEMISYHCMDKTNINLGLIPASPFSLPIDFSRYFISVSGNMIVIWSGGDEKVKYFDIQYIKKKPDWEIKGKCRSELFSTLTYKEKNTENLLNPSKSC